MVFVLAIVLALPSCDSSVEPFQESGYYFSIGGVIDASLDTQFVRVNPLRSKAEVDPEPYDIIVTTRDLSSGEEHVWRDSVFVLSDGRYAHNFWSTADFSRGGVYRFTAERPDGLESRAEIALPDTARIVVQTIPFDPIATVNVFGAEKLADLKLIYCASYRGGDIERVDASLIDEVSDFGQGFTVRVNPYALALEIGLGQIYWIRVAAIAAGPEWPDFENIDEETLALPHVYSNVEDGVGYLGGVTSTLVNWPGFAPQAPECVPLLSRW